MMHQRYSDFNTMIMLPQIFAKITAKTLNTVHRTLDSQNYDFSLRTKLFTCECDFISCLCWLENSYFFVFDHFDLRVKRFSKMALFQQLSKVISEMTVLNGQFDKNLAGLSFSSWRHGFIFDTRRNFHFLDQWCSFGLFFFGLIFSEHYFTEADSFD
jgi:hypothetical protein